MGLHGVTKGTAVHAGFYTNLNGKYPKDLWSFLESVRKLEIEGEGRVKAFAGKFRAAGFAEVADEMNMSVTSMLSLTTGLCPICSQPKSDFQLKE